MAWFLSSHTVDTAGHAVITCGWCWAQDLRADRQLEFTQLDLEMAFSDCDVIMGLMERLVTAIFQEVGMQLDL